MPLNPSGAISLGGPVTGQSIAVELGLSPTASISLNGTDVRTLAQVPSGAIIMPTNFWGKSATVPGLQRGIFAFGSIGPTGTTNTSNVNYLSDTGIVGNDSSTVGTPGRNSVSGASYGGDKAFLAYGNKPPGAPNLPGRQLDCNLVSNTGVVAAFFAGGPRAKEGTASATYGIDKGIVFGGTGNPPGVVFLPFVNYVSNTGVFSSETPSAASRRSGASAYTYGTDKAIIAFGVGTNPPSPTPIRQPISNLVSNTGTVASDNTTAGTTRLNAAACGYGGDKLIIAYGVVGTPAPAAVISSISNTVSNTGVVSSDVPGVGTSRTTAGGATYGGDKGCIAYGAIGPLVPADYINLSNLISNTGIVASDTPGVGSTKSRPGSASYSLA